MVNLPGTGVPGYCQPRLWRFVKKMTFAHRGSTHLKQNEGCYGPVSLLAFNPEPVVHTSLVSTGNVDRGYSNSGFA